MWDTRVQSVGGEDPLEKGMTNHSSIFAWRIPWTEEPCKLQSKESDMTERLHFTGSLAPSLSFQSLFNHSVLIYGGGGSNVNRVRIGNPQVKFRGKTMGRCPDGHFPGQGVVVEMQVSSC